MSQLTPIQEQVLAALLAGKSVSAVARENGIHRSTIYHWRHEHPYFGVALEQARSRHQVNLYDFIQDLTEQALETVATLLESDTIRHNPTLKSEPARNSRCSCGSGLKYKRCCGSVVAPSMPPLRESAVSNSRG